MGRGSSTVGVLAFLGALVSSTVSATGCASKKSPSDAATVPSDFGGIYASTTDAEFGVIAFGDDGTYYWLRTSCTTIACTEVGAWSIEEERTKLHLVSSDGDDRSLPLEILQTWSEDADGPLTEGGSSLVPQDETVSLVDQNPTSSVTRIAKAKIGDTVVDSPKLVQKDGKIAGVGTVRPLSDPGGRVIDFPNGVGFWSPDQDQGFSQEGAKMKLLEGSANVYTAHGLPGGMEGGVMEPQVRKFLNETSQPLIVDSCFGGAPIKGGSTIQRLVSTYANDVSGASTRIIGCTGFSYASHLPDKSFGCSGKWVDANGSPVSLDQRNKLLLVQQECKTSAIGRHGDIELGCKNP